MFSVSDFNAKIYSFDLVRGLCIVSVDYDNNEVNFSGNIYVYFKEKEIELRTIDHQEAQTLDEEQLVDFMDKISDYIEEKRAFYKSMITFIDYDISEYLGIEREYRILPLPM